MRTVKFKKLFGSVFTRLLLTILVTGFLINLLVIGLFGYIRHRMDASMHAHLVQYIQYITQDLGVPPNLERAREIARAASMTIRYTSPGENWSTSENFNPRPSRRVHIWHEEPGMMAGSSRGRYFVKVRHGDGELLFQAARGRAAVDEIQKVLLVLICLFSLVLVLAETWIPADQEKAGIALKNVIDNALKYSEKGLEPVEVSLTRAPGKALVIIRDKGIGIPVEDQPYIFEPFYRADKSRTRKTGGFGLGLSMCKTIMAAHGGSIELNSAVNQGTTVILTFPAEPYDSGEEVL